MENYIINREDKAIYIPKKLFYVTTASYIFFAVIMVFACIFIRYPVPHSARYVKSELVNGFNQVSVYIGDIDQFKRNGIIELMLSNGRKISGKIVQLNRLPKSSGTIMVIHISNEHPLKIIVNQNVTVVDYRRLLWLLIEKNSP